jgi:hypothetical protein
MAKNKRLRAKIDKVASPVVARPRSREQLYMEGKTHRESCARLSYAKWKPPADRVDPVEILEASNQGRLPELIPIRYGRMIPSPFVFYRGAAPIMAADLAKTPNMGIRVQSCGDAHLFGEALADFATAYAEQNERDYQAMLSAVRQGRIKVLTES